MGSPRLVIAAVIAYAASGGTALALLVASGCGGASTEPPAGDLPPAVTATNDRTDTRTGDSKPQQMSPADATDAPPATDSATPTQPTDLGSAATTADGAEPRQPPANLPGAQPSPQASVKPGINKRFLDPKLDVDRWQKTFEGESREVSVHRRRIVAALSLEPGQAIADVGAGTGLFLPAFHRAVGPTGKVYAVEISPRFLDHLRRRAQKDRLTRVEVVTGSDRSVELAAESVDVVFVCDTYHHFEYPSATLASIHRALRPGGRLVIVDFERIPGKTPRWILDHVRAGKDVFRREIERAGFRFQREFTIRGLIENYAIAFTRE